MDIEWDAQKARKVLVERGIDFEDAAIALLQGDVLLYASKRQDENRYVGLVEVCGKVWAVVHLWRGETLRIITVRRARVREERDYGQLYSQRVEGSARKD